MDPSVLYSRVRVSRRRRLASPVRLTLAPQLGGTVDGAWWPRVTCVAQELADLLDAVGQPLGAITDVTLNGASTGGARFVSPTGKSGPHNADLHVVALVGGHASANLLIVPYLTTISLAVMVLRRAANMAISDAQQATATFRLADCIVRTACAERAMCNAIAVRASS